MKIRGTILLAGFIMCVLYGNTQPGASHLKFDFLGSSIEMPRQLIPNFQYTASLSETSIQKFYDDLKGFDDRSLIEVLMSYRDKLKLDDWLYYQLIRKTAQQISPKAENYFSYTL